MRLLGTIFLVFAYCWADDISSSAVFDCNRIDIAFCCTTRVRTICADHCRDVQCGVQETGVPDESTANIRRGPEPAFHIEMMTPPPPMDPSNQFIPPSQQLPPVHDGHAELLRPSANPPPPPLAFKNTPFTQSPLTGFPTLIPFEPSIDDNEEIAKSEITDIPVVHSTVVKSMHHRVRTTPDPRIIRPPESLVVIGDYDDDDNEKEPPARIGTTRTADRTDPAVVFTRESSQSGGIAMPKSSISEEVGPPRGESTALEQPSSSRWNVKVLPAQKLITWPEEAKLPPHYAVDGDSSKPDESENQPDDKTLIKTFSIAPSKANMIPAGIIDYIEPKVIQFINHVRTTQKPFRMTKNALRSSRPRSRPTATTVPLPVRQATTPLPPQPRPIFNKPLEPMQPQPNVPIPPVTQPTCGVAPDFTPCVSSEEASHALMDCCRRKNLPAGCLSLCRYDITQAEVRSAMDRGLCGIFSVAPYLECASQGKDNTECCRYKGLAQKTGPQCEQFCRPSYGLSALGLQHIVCGNAIGDMLHCHHAGIRR
ncbi:hypothetical protein V3C99_004899 [Haemonchus contortus]